MTTRIHRWRAAVVPVTALVVALGGAPGATAHQAPAASASAPTVTLGPATVATPAANTAPVTVRKRSITLRTGPTLHVNVNPNLKGKRSWKLRLQRLGTTGWRTLGTYRTEGRAETRSFTVAAGTYRVKVSAGHGRKARTSGVLVHRPPGPRPSPPLAPPAPKPIPPPKPVPVARVTLGASMTPAASRGISDYVTTCAGGEVTATITAGNGGAVAFDGGARLTASTTRTVALTAGQQLSWVLQVPGAVPVTQHARCLPDDFPTWTVERPGTPASQWYMFSPAIFSSLTNHYAIVTDNRGTPVWWTPTGTAVPVDLTLLPGDRIAWTSAAGGFSFAARYEQHRWDGTTLPAIGPGQAIDHHDLVPLPNGHLLALRYRPRACPAVPSECVDMRAYGGTANGVLLDGEVVELDEAGQIVWSWPTRGRIDLPEAEPHLRSDAMLVAGGVEYWDYLHLNSVEPDGDGFIVSARNTDAVYRVDRATGQIEWKLGGTRTPRSLKVSGDVTTPFLSSQHDARRAPDGSLTLFDNGSLVPDRAPRVLRLTVDPGTRVATVRQVVTDPNAPPTGCCGGARAVLGDGMAIAWGGGLGGLITETDAAGRAVLRIRTGTGFTYRVAPVPPGRVASEQLRAGMNAMHPRSSPAGGTGTP